MTNSFIIVCISNMDLNKKCLVRDSGGVCSNSSLTISNWINDALTDCLADQLDNSVELTDDGMNITQANPLMA